MGDIGVAGRLVVAFQSQPSPPANIPDASTSSEDCDALCFSAAITAAAKRERRRISSLPMRGVVLLLLLRLLLLLFLLLLLLLMLFLLLLSGGKPGLDGGDKDAKGLSRMMLLLRCCSLERGGGWATGEE
jgi:hypothetical protein